MKRAFMLLFAVLISSIVLAQSEQEYFLPKDISYNKNIPSPKQFTGNETGEWHFTHDKLVYYIMELAKLSDRAIWKEYARSYENRPLGQLIISSPENIKNIEKLREEHLKLCDPSVSGTVDVSNMPLFVKLGYGVHGNESSAQNSSALVAYYLLAGEGEKMDELLKNTVILLDPSLNPDGMQRHSTWVNSTRSLNNNPDPNSWEFNETWPGGRTNHYWFDLNRDYILLQHPETRGRIAEYYYWRPNIITDHHEMDAGSTFFFQPGVQSRNNPLIGSDNQELTAEIGKFHEKYLNRIGSLYFTEEGYDDFYVGKGSSYPDIHGAIGILFEQAGVKGHLRNTQAGQISFPFAIRNQFNVSLSSLEAGMNMRKKLLESQRDFYKEALIQSDKYPVKAFVFSENDDKGRMREFISILLQHKIKLYNLSRDFSAGNMQFKAGESYIVPLKQNEYRFIRSLFEPVKKFTDSVFYDISTWVLPMSFNIRYSQVEGVKDIQGLTGVELTATPGKEGALIASGNPYAYLFEWNDYYAPKALFQLQNAGITARVATDKFTSNDGTLKKDFSFGTIMITVSEQHISASELKSLVEKTALDCGIIIYGTTTGLTPSGIDLGSAKFRVVQKPSILMFAGDGASGSDAGEIWHMLDTRFNMPVTMVTASRFANINLNNYNILIIDGSPNLGQQALENIRSWNRNGGTIIGYKAGNKWLSENKLADIEVITEAASKLKTGIFANRSGDSQVNDIPGTIFESTLDLTHPLCYGYTFDKLPVFKSDPDVYAKDKNIYNNPAVYSLSPLLSGYSTPVNIDRVKGAPFVSLHGNRIISIYDNANFRSVTWGTNKIFMNALFFGQLTGR